MKHFMLVKVRTKNWAYIKYTDELLGKAKLINQHTIRI